MKLKLNIALAGIFFFLFAAGQQRDGMEYVIKDTVTLQLYKSTIAELKKTGKTAELARTLKRIADYYYKQPVVDSQLHYYKEALKQYEIVKDSFHIAYCFFRIGEETAYHTDRYDESLSWHLPAAGYFERSGENHMAAFSNYAISTLYKGKKDEQKRQYYLNRAIAFNKLAKDTLLDIIIISTLASDWQETKNWDEMYRQSSRAVELSRSIQQPVFVKIGLLMMGRAEMQKGNNEKAIPLLEESSKIMAHTNNAHPEAFRFLAIAYARLNKGKEAERYFGLYKYVLDSISAKAKDDNYAELLVQYQDEKKLATIAALERENRLKEKLSGNQRVFIILLIAGLTAVLVTGFVFYRNFKRRQRLEKELNKQQEFFTKQLHGENEQKMTAEFNRQLAEVQLTALSAQMNPHFIFNCMNSIQNYILKNEKKKALDFLQNFSELMRNVLDNSTRSKVGLDDEINMLEKYILLEQQRLENRFDYKIETAASLQTDFFEIPGMIIQPYVENAIWHGLMNKEYSAGHGDTKGLLLVTFHRENGFIKCVVEDNGAGRKKAAEMEKQKSPQRKGYGMAIAQKRLELLQKENEKVPEIIIDDLMNGDEPAGTRVTIFIHSE